MKLLLRNIYIITALLVLSCTTTRKSIAIESGWQLLGQSKVNFVRDVDEIDVNIFEKFTAIRFQIEDREVRLNNLKIYLDNGDILQPAIDEVIQAGQFSRDIHIATEGRMIDKIQFRYRTTGNVLRGRANVLVFGKRHEPNTY